MDRPQTSFDAQPGPAPVRLRTLSAASLVALSLTAGCKGLGKDVEHPVVGAPPPRINRLSDQLLGDLDKSRAQSEDGIQQMQLVQAQLDDEDIAARVNGNPIFVSEILERHKPQLAMAQGKMPPDALAKLKRDIVKQDLSHHIEQALALDAARTQLKKEQWDQLQQKLDEYFYETEIPRLTKELGVKTPQEVEAIMLQNGTSMTAYRRVWADRTLAAQWVGEHLKSDKVSAPELRAEYQKRIREFTEPEQIKWQECFIPKAPDPGAAQAKLRSAIGDLRAGKTFDDIVQGYSSAPNASAGGFWDWMQVESLSDEKLRQSLAQLQVDEVGPVVEDARGYRLIKLNGRRASRTQPFEAVQNEIRDAVLQQKKAAAAQKLIDDLKAKAHIETMFDAENRRT